MCSIRGLGRSIADAFTAENGKKCGKTSLKVLGGVALAAIATFGVLGLLQAHGHLSHTFSWLDTALKAVPQEALYGMIGAAALVPLVMLGVKTFKERQLLKKDIEAVGALNDGEMHLGLYDKTLYIKHAGEDEVEEITPNKYGLYTAKDGAQYVVNMKNGKICTVERDDSLKE